MEKKSKWDIEEFRTKYESEEHWNLKKDFLLAHKDKFKKNRLICLAQVFVNVQLMRCKYPDPVMSQVAELAKGIGVDYKTKQKERLQRTFVKASDAAAAKVKKLKVNYAETDCKTKSNNNGNETSDHNESKIKSKHPQISYDTVSSESIEQFLKKKKNTKKKSHNDIKEVSVSQIVNVSKTKNKYEIDSESNDTLEVPPKKKGDITANEDENPVVNKYSKALKTNTKIGLVSFVSPKVTSILDKTKPKVDNPPPKSFDECFDPKDLYKSNIFLVSRSFSKFTSYPSILNGCLQFSKLNMDTTFIPFNKFKETCILTTKVKGQVLKLGEAVDTVQNSGRENAIKNAVENLLKRCYTIVIKKKADNDEEISISKSNPQKDNEQEQNSNQERLDSNNVGAKMLKLMGWSGGGLGKNEDGIKDPVSVSTPIGRAGLGVKDENFTTPIFKSKVKNILDEMRNKIYSTADIVKDIVFSSELSNEQRKYIHLTVRTRYKQLNTISYGKGTNRYLVIRPKLDPQSIVYQVLLQGGETDKYQIHKPGSISVNDFFPQD